MGLFGKLMSRFSRTRHLGQVSYDDLRKERLRLEQIEHRIGSEMEEIETRKKQLFEEGRDTGNQRQQLLLARRIKDLDTQARAKEDQLKRVAQQARVVGGLMVIKENEKLTAELGVSGIVSRLDMDTLEKYVDRATVDGQFQMERFAQMVQTLESAGSLTGEVEDDEDTLKIMQAMQDARDAEAGTFAEGEAGSESAVADGSQQARAGSSAPGHKGDGDNRESEPRS